jgi:hypothetical protein
MFLTMEFTKEKLAVMLAECLRILRPGGLFV